MIRAIVIAIWVAAGIGAGIGAGPGAAAERPALGWGRLLTNDFIGDGRDRWRTGNYTVSQIRGGGWNGRAPRVVGALLEYRARAEVISPESLTAPAPGDRRYAGTLAFGVHSHVALGAAEARVGVDLVLTGPQTGLGRAHRFVHGVIGIEKPRVLGSQIGNGVHPTLSGEIGRAFHLGERVRLRPFAEAQLGVETFVRAGGDIVIGDFGRGALMLRDTATGQRYRSIGLDPVAGLSLVLGGDVAHVADSRYLDDAILIETRRRLRAGLHWQGERAALFYGATWLSEEFRGQPDTQVLGSVRIDIAF